MTLDDLERLKRTLADYGAHQKNFNNDGSIPLAAKCRPTILVSRNIPKDCANITGVPYIGGAEQQWGS